MSDLEKNRSDALKPLFMGLRGDLSDLSDLSDPLLKLLYKIYKCVITKYVNCVIIKYLALFTGVLFILYIFKSDTSDNML